MRVLHLVDRWSDRGGAYQHLAGLLEEERRAGLVVAVAAGVQQAAPLLELHVVPGLERRTWAPFDLGGVVAKFGPDLIHVHTVVNPAVLEWAAERPSLITGQAHRYFCPTRGKWTLAGEQCREPMRHELCAACFEEDGYFREVYALTEARLSALRRLRVVTLSRYMAAELSQAGVPASTLRIIPPFVHGLEARA